MSAPTRSEPVRLRPIALPVEHGGWAFLGARAALGLLPAALRAPAPLVGVQEIGFSLLTVAAIAFGLR